MSFSYRYQGGSLTRDDPTYVERKADSILYRELLAGNFCYVLTSRQMGKSSLRIRTQARLQNEDIKCISIDLSSIGNQSEDKWFRGIAYRLFKKLDLPEGLSWKKWWAEHDFLAPSQLLRELIDELLLASGEQDIILFFDEIDAVLGLEFNTGNFFAIIRSFYNNRVDDPKYQRLTFCLLGVSSPNELIEDEYCTPFNIGVAITLKGFRLEEAKQSLLEGLEANVNDAEETLAEIIHWTGGQPYLTQKVCHIVVNHSHHNVSETLTVEQLIKNFIIQDWETNDNPPHLRPIISKLISQNEKTIKMLNLYREILLHREIKPRHNVYESELILSGLIIQVKDSLKINNLIYQEVFNLDWTEKKLEDVWQALQASGKADSIAIISPQFRELAYILLVCLIIFLISFLSIWSSYYWFTSEPWLQTFDWKGYGANIELIRSALFVVGTFYFIGLVWRKEAVELVRGTQAIVKRWRRTFVSIGIVVFGLSLYYHLWLGPVTLSSEYRVTNQVFITCFIPYLLFLPYTLVNYNLLALSWVAVSSYGAVKDLNKNLIRTHQFGEKLIYLEEMYESRPHQNNDFIIATVEKEFAKFSTNLITLISRYTVLLLALCISVIFETLWGANTLADNAKNFMILTYSLSTLALVFIFWVFYHYHIALRKASIFLFNHNFNYSDFEVENSFKSLIKRILSSHLNLYLFAFLSFIFGLICVMRYLISLLG